MKITQLTPEQEVKMIEYRDKYIKIGLRAEPQPTKVLISVSKSIMNNIINIDLPVITAHSPLGCWFTLCLLNDHIEQVMEQVRGQVGGKYGSK
jgi:hypothetical protein